MQDVVADIIRGTKAEQKTFADVSQHYVMAKNDLQQRISRKGGFDDSDKLFFGHIPSDWPFQSEVFDPRIATVLFEKDARLLGNKPKGRFVAREGGDEVGAFVNNELFNFQWDDVARIGAPMLIRWFLMSQQARRYGISFGVTKWHYEMRGDKCFYDGPDMQVIYARDALPDPSFSEIKNWFQYREWVTLADLKRVNDMSKEKEGMWKNLNQIAEVFREEERVKGQSRSTDYVIKAKSLRGIQDTLGQDALFKTFEIVHERRPDRWITFAPKLGVVIRDIPNPYKHGEIGVIPLKYNPITDDLYGFSEVETVASTQRAINALLCQYIDAVNHDLYPPLMINPSGVRMHTIEFKPDAKWLMNRPGQDVIRMQTSTAATNTFSNTYALLVSSLQNATGETSAAYSQLAPGQQERTATEIRETTSIRNVRDNLNQIMLSEALKKQAYYWMEMNKQFLFSDPKQQQKVIRIVGRDAMSYFLEQGMDQESEPGKPLYPVPGANDTLIPQFEPTPSGQEGDLYVTQKDIEGAFDFIPDVESMHVASDQEIQTTLTMALNLLTNPTILQSMAAEGKKPKVTELVIKLLETTKAIKNAESFFENAPQSTMGGVDDSQINPTGAGGVSPGGAVGPVDQVGGVPSPQVPPGANLA